MQFSTYEFSLTPLWFPSIKIKCNLNVFLKNNIQEMCITKPRMSLHKI